MDPISLLILVAVGGACGILETRHLNGRGLSLPFNVAAGALGGIGAGWFFNLWGQLYFGWFGPMASGIIGAAILLPTLNWLIAFVPGKFVPKMVLSSDSH